MKTMGKWRKNAPFEPIGYEEAKALARHPEPERRRALAGREDVRPEILYYLADDETPLVRREVAANKATPGQANLRLAKDIDVDVRCRLAEKIGRLLPELGLEERNAQLKLAVQVIEVLADDQLPKVRSVLAQAVKDSGIVPRKLIRKLAEDLESIVAVPVLEFSPLLEDADLIEIIEAGAASARLAAIARRRELGPNVCDAVAATLDETAVADLLANPSAQVREATLDLLIDHAAQKPGWHMSLAGRPALSARAVRRIAGFIGRALVEMLARRSDLDPETQAALGREVERGLDAADAEPHPPKPSGAETELEPDSRVQTPSAQERAKTLLAKGELDDVAVADAVDRKDRAFVLEALALLVGRRRGQVARIFEMKNPKAITALAWKAGLGMRLAVKLQQKIAQIPPGQVLNARNGFDFPMTDADLAQAWSLFAE
jgi:uncharacterized protein (DUF2336 family)